MKTTSGGLPFVDQNLILGGSICMDLLTSDGEHSPASFESLIPKTLYQDGFPATGEYEIET